MTLKKVISGGQIGVDMMGLMAAQACGIPTGGTAPKNFKTRNGSMPHLEETFGLTEDASPTYPPRTKKNVKDSSGTLRIAHNFNTAGERCTMKYLKQLRRPYCDVLLSSDGVIEEDQLEKVTDFIERSDIEVLNIAGNASLSTKQMLEVVHFLVDVFESLGYKMKENI